jgi:hypothetical protein
LTTIDLTIPEFDAFAARVFARITAHLAHIPELSALDY